MSGLAAREGVQVVTTTLRASRRFPRRNDERVPEAIGSVSSRVVPVVRCGIVYDFRPEDLPVARFAESNKAHRIWTSLVTPLEYHSSGDQSITDTVHLHTTRAKRDDSCDGRRGRGFPIAGLVMTVSSRVDGMPGGSSRPSAARRFRRQG